MFVVLHPKEAAMTVKEAYTRLEQSLTPLYGLGEAKSISNIVFKDYLKLSLQSEKDDHLFEALLQDDYLKIEERLLSSEPVQYVVGFSWFYGLNFKVNPSVLIPRPETEELVHWVLETVKSKSKVQSQHPTSILDIGTGSGCIPITLKLKHPSLKVSALDVSEAALITATKNAYRLQAEVHFQRVNILDTRESDSLSQYDTIISNPPYIPNKERSLMSDNVLKYEPELALFVEDEDPLIFYITIADFAIKHLPPKGYLFFECNAFNAIEVVDMLKRKGFKEVELRKDMSGQDRMIRAIL